jgi:hypothetical protein
MSYWGDRRDELEKAYPTCTSFLRFHPEYQDSAIEGIRCGIVFLYAAWSGPSGMRFKSACYALEDSVPWDRFTFDVVDVDGLTSSNRFEAHETLGGYGEAFWIHSGKILKSMGRDWSNHRFDQFTQELLQAEQDGGGPPATGPESK